MTNTTLSTHKLTPAIGAEIAGIDLSELLDQSGFDDIYQALIEHQVIFFRGQNISPACHLALARSFGEPQPKHPVYPHREGFENIVVLKNDGDNPPDTDGWHTDLTFHQNPPFASILVARHVPDCGGDTLWTSLYQAYESLSESMKNELEALQAVHDMGDFRNNFSIGKTDGGEIIEAHQKFGSSIHPIVKAHPVTGRKFLYVNEGFTQHIVGLRATDSNQLLNFLYHHINQPENQVRFKWSTGDMAIWDNRCTQHYAVADYMPAEREMNRITVINDARATG